MAVSKILERWAFPVTSTLGKKGEEPLSPTGNQVVSESSQFHIVTLNSSGELELAVSGNETLFVLEDTPKQGERGTVALVGVAKVLLATGVTVGKLVGCNNAGEGQPALAGQWVLGVALETGVAGQIVPVLLNCGAGAHV